MEGCPPRRPRSPLLAAPAPPRPGPVPPRLVTARRQVRASCTARRCLCWASPLPALSLGEKPGPGGPDVLGRLQDRCGYATGTLVTQNLKHKCSGILFCFPALPSPGPQLMDQVNGVCQAAEGLLTEGQSDLRGKGSPSGERSSPPGQAPSAASGPPGQQASGLCRHGELKPGSQTDLLSGTTGRTSGRAGILGALGGVSWGPSCLQGVGGARGAALRVVTSLLPVPWPWRTLSSPAEGWHLDGPHGQPDGVTPVTNSDAMAPGSILGTQTPCPACRPPPRGHLLE